MCVDTHTHTHAHAPPAQAGKAPFLCHRLAEANLSPRPAPIATRDGHPSLKLFPPFWGLSRAVHTSLLAGLVADLPLLAVLVALACHPPRGHLQPSSGQLLLCFFFFFLLLSHPAPPASRVPAGQEYFPLAHRSACRLPSLRGQFFRKLFLEIVTSE